MKEKKKTLRYININFNQAINHYAKIEHVTAGKQLLWKDGEMETETMDRHT